MTDRQVLFACIADDPGDALLRLALADCLRDEGGSEEIAGEAIGHIPPNHWNNRRVFGIGSSSIGSGSSIGIGIGIGSGIGSGSGSGIGRGSGSGSGSGIGIGIGIGRGRGIGSETQGRIFMEPGKAYLVHCGDWHTVCGRVVKQVGPFTYLMEKVSKIADTNSGDSWDRLADGDIQLRKKCDYKHHKGNAVVPLNLLAFEWAGKLPQEEA